MACSIASSWAAAEARFKALWSFCESRPPVIVAEGVRGETVRFGVRDGTATRLSGGRGGDGDDSDVVSDEVGVTGLPRLAGVNGGGASCSKEIMREDAAIGPV